MDNKKQKSKPTTFTTSSNVEKLLVNLKTQLMKDCNVDHTEGSCTHTGWSD